MERCGQSLGSLMRQCDLLVALHRQDLHPGDALYVRTCHSLYCIRIEDQRRVLVSGGWFDRTRNAPVRTTIAGCTWGGSVIRSDVMAAVGLSLEFGNRVTTSPIRRILLLRRERQN